jgi:hypothetical protein
MGPVAGITITIQDRFMGIGFQKFSHGIGMTRVTDLVQPVLDNIFNIRTMGIMARIALPFGKGGMGNFDFLRFFCFCMA